MLTIVYHIYFPGTMAAAYVNGLQSEGVSASASHHFLLVPGQFLLVLLTHGPFRTFLAIKHFVGNDQEHERTAADSVVSERALREIYLYP